MSVPVGYPRRSLGLRDSRIGRHTPPPRHSPDVRLPWDASAVAVRLVVLLAGVAVLLVPAQPKPIVFPLLVIGLAIAVTSPARGGAAVAVIAGIAGWFACYGTHGAPPVWRVLAFGCALYLLHSSAALAGAVPISARLDRPTALRWARRWLLHVAIAGALAAISYASTSGLPGSASQLAELAGLTGAVLVLGVIGWLFSRSLRR
ncbi:MAG: hypothetical protein ABI140_03675 [Jatrophihabitantaceae bacterium]